MLKKLLSVVSILLLVDIVLCNHLDVSYSGPYPDRAMANPKVLNLTDEQKKGIKIYIDAKWEADKQFGNNTSLHDGRMGWFKNKQDRLKWERQKREDPKPRDVNLTQKSRSHQDKHLTVHLVPHTHDDVGWGKTYEEYFLGADNKVVHANVRQILDEVLQQLPMNKNRTFTYVEMKYFNMWYTRLSQSKKNEVKKLIKSGQLEITQGGWVANDEACTNYEDIIMQMYIGHQFLKKEFGVVPRIGWMLDAFGHSTANAALFADMGFDAIYFARIDEKSRAEWKKPDQKKWTFLWRPFSKNMGQQKEILAGVYNKESYDYPEGFKIDERQDGDTGIKDDPTMMDYNAQEKAVKMINYVQETIDYRQNTENMMVLMGDDFAFMNAYQNYNQLETLIRVGNEIQKVNMTFVMSTPSRFTDALKKEKVNWPVKEDDIFPYISDITQSWSGFFSSRPGLKKQAKDSSAFFNAEQSVFARTVIDQNTTQKQAQKINDLSFAFNDALGVMQHHDAITGTEQDYVAMDYRWRLSKREQQSLGPYRKWIGDKMSKETGILAKNATTDLLMCVGTQNDTVIDCPVNDHKDQSEFIVAIHNPRSSNAFKDFARIILPDSTYKAQVWSPSEGKFLDQSNDLIEQKHWRKNGTIFSDYQMFIKLKDASALVTYVKVLKTVVPDEPKQSLSEVDQDKSLTIKGFSDSGEVLFTYVHRSQGIEQTFGVNLKKYLANQKKPRDANREFIVYSDLTDVEKANEEIQEGAYLLKPKWDDPLPHQYGKLDQDVEYQKGRNLEQWTIKYDNSNGAEPVAGKYEQAFLKVRFSETFQEIIEFEVELNAVPVQDDQGKDVIVTWKMFDGFNANKTYWTDSNGLEMQERHFTKYFNDSAIYQNQSITTYDISNNYFPVPQAISMRDFSNSSNLQVTIMNDRAQGGSADLHDSATIELMQNRVLVRDDEKGVAQDLNETDADEQGLRISAKYYMQIFDTEKGRSVQRERQLVVQQPLYYFFVFNYNQQDSFTAQNSTPITLNSVVNSTVQYRLLPVDKNIIRARFDNLADKFDATAQTFTIDIGEFARELYQDVNNQALPASISVKEMSLTANQLHKTMMNKKIHWQGKTSVPPLSSNVQSLANENQNIFDFEPQRMRQFEIEYNKLPKTKLVSIKQENQVEEQAPARIQTEDLSYDIENLNFKA